MTMKKCICAIILQTLFIITYGQQSKVIIKEEQRIIPTYEVGVPDGNPRFYDGRNTQGAQGRIYPYPMSDRLTDNKIDKQYKIITLENEYVRIEVMPELGGRIFRAVDKTNNYDFFYYNKVIKPALIGTLGEWISGGVEFNFPHHHKANTMVPANYLLVENTDGSATVWIEELDLRARLTLTLSMTLYPGKSYLEVKVNPANPTPMVQTFLYWANPAVHVDSTYQVLFPPNVQYVVDHAKRAFTEWPVTQSTLYRSDLLPGTNISWWKNLKFPVSFFAWNYETDYFGGYNHGKDAGVVYIGNHHLAPGMKFFTFGGGRDGQAWDERLTDDDGPYLELMAGAFSDNQPDYSFIRPNESKFTTQYWFPVHKLQGMEFANLNGALTLSVQNNSLSVKLITTSKQTDARLKIVNGQETVVDKVINISPDAPFSFETSVNLKIVRTNVEVTLIDRNGELLLAYKPQIYDKIKMPKAVVPPINPGDIATVEELFIEGSRLDQFYNTQVPSAPYYDEALKRDSLNSSVNIQLGIECCKKFMWLEAEEYLSKAIARIADNYVHPKNAEAYYYLGYAQEQQNKIKQACDNYYKATWDAGMAASAFFRLANIDCKAGKYLTALDLISRSLDFNRKNLQGISLISIIQNKLGFSKKALLLLEQTANENPLDLTTLNQLVLTYRLIGDTDKESQYLKRITEIMGTNPQSFLETAAFYMNCGEYGSIIDLISRIDITKNPGGSSYPELYYYLGYCYDHTNKQGLSEKYYKLAAGLSPEYCFPFRFESLQVLKEAYSKNHSDGNCAYYLGNLMYDNQPSEALKWWNIAVGNANPTYHVFRNLAYAYSTLNKDYAKAIPLMEKAISMNNKDPRLFYELDIMFENNKTDIATRLNILEKNLNVVKLRADLTNRLVGIYTISGKYDKAIQLLTSYHFFTAEGERGIRTYYEDAFILNGINNYDGKKYAKAIENFMKADEYPSNMEVGRPARPERVGQIYFYIGLCYEGLRNKAEATKYFQKAVEYELRNSPYLYYQSLAFLKLGKNEDAERVRKRLEEYANRGITADFFSKFDERSRADFAQRYYLLGLTALSKLNKSDATANFQKALENNPNYYWAKSGLNHLVKL